MKKISLSQISEVENFLTLETIVNNLTAGGSNKVLSAEQGKFLKGQLDTVNLLLASNYIDLNTLQKVGDSVKVIQTNLSTLLVNNLTAGGSTKALTAEQGKILKAELNAIKLILSSDDINLDTIQELVDAIKTVKTYLETILVNDLTTGGITKALTAEMGKSLKILVDSLATNKLDKGTYPGTAEDLKQDIDDIYQPDTVIRTTEPTRVGNVFTFPIGGYEVVLDKIRKTNVLEFVITIAPAAEDNKRTDLIYFKPDSTLDIVQGEQDLTLTKIPEVPAGCIGILYLSIYGDTVENPTEAKEKLSDFIDDIGAIDLEEVKVTDKAQIVNKVLDVTKKYSIRKNLSLTASESIWMDNSPLIEGLGADFITIETTEPNSRIFTATNCQNFNLKNIALSPKGAGSKAFELKDGTGVHEFRLVGVNFLSAENLGTIDGFRQWYCTDVGFYNNCKNGFELKGTTSGILFTETNLIGFAATGKLFKQGTGLTINDRALIQMNFSVPTGFVFMDFMPSVFTSNEALQIVDCVAKVNGTKDDNNTIALFPNISPNNPKCVWSNNTGIANTAIEKIIINPTVASTFVINWLNDSYDITLTANTTFTESNLPASGRRTKTLNITIVGNYTPTFPAAWELNKIGTFKKGELNSITIKFISAGKYAMRIDNSLTVYPAPRLGSIFPNSLLPESTVPLRLNGSFFTPASIVKIEGQTVNTIDFDDDTGSLDLSVTTGVTEGDFDIEVSNGTNVIYNDRLPIVVGTVFVPTKSDWSSVTFSENVDEYGSFKINSYNVIQSGIWNKEINITKNVSFRFKISKSALGDMHSGSSEFKIKKIFFLDALTGNEVFAISFTFAGGLYMLHFLNGSSAQSSETNLAAFVGTQKETVQNYFSSRSLELRINGGVIRCYVNKVLIKDFANPPITNNIKFKVSTKTFDVTNIKYIELAT